MRKIPRKIKTVRIFRRVIMISYLLSQYYRHGVRTELKLSNDGKEVLQVRAWVEYGPLELADHCCFSRYSLLDPRYRRPAPDAPLQEWREWVEVVLPCSI